MKKIIICDRNKELIDRLKSRIVEGVQPSGVELTFVCGDIIDLHEKTANSRIVTASNPSFSPDGGLDAELAQKYQWTEPREFKWTDDLFWTISVGDDRMAEKWRVKRALAGVLGQAHRFTLLVPGLGTGVGGLDQMALIKVIVEVCRNADFRNADFRYANFRYADLPNADFRNADFRYADFQNADLRYADFQNADLQNADLQYADLQYADFQYADFQNADFQNADFQNAKNLETVKHNASTAGFAMVCPEKGSFIGWKKASEHIIKLRIPAKALRSSATSRKCRCSEAKVLAIYDKNGKRVSKGTSVCSDYNEDFKYVVGEVVKPLRKFNPDRWVECASGIHFFITRGEAEQWEF